MEEVKRVGEVEKEKEENSKDDYNCGKRFEGLKRRWGRMGVSWMEGARRGGVLIVKREGG